MADDDLDPAGCVILATGLTLMGLGLSGYAAWQTGWLWLGLPAAFCFGWLAWTAYVFARHWPRD